MRAKLMTAVVLGGLLLAFTARSEESVAGIGIDLGIHQHKMKIIHVLTNTPASKAGLSAGLVVQKIDGKTTEGKSLDDCVKMIRGASGTKVTLELVDTSQNKTNTVELTRTAIKR